MVMVPASMLTENPAKRKHPKKRHHHHHPRKHNPGEPPGAHSHVKDALAAVGFGTVAAVAGLAGGYALAKANLKTPGANAAANIAAGAAIGGGLGMLDRAAGTVVAHNYMVAAGQWLMPRAAPMPVEVKALPAPRGVRSAATPQLMNARPPMPIRGVDEVSGVVADNMNGFENLHGVVADNLGATEEISAPEELTGFEKLQGVADEVGAPDDVNGPDDITGPDDVNGPDDLGAVDILGEIEGAEELGEEDLHGAEELGDLGYIAG